MQLKPGGTHTTPTYGSGSRPGPQRFRDGQWGAYYVPGQRLAIVIEDETADVVSIPLTAVRARALIQLLHGMLTAAGESTGVMPTGQLPDGSWLLRDLDTEPDYVGRS